MIENVTTTIIRSLKTQYRNPMCYRTISLMYRYKNDFPNSLVEKLRSSYVPTDTKSLFQRHVAFFVQSLRMGFCSIVNLL